MSSFRTQPFHSIKLGFPFSRAYVTSPKKHYDAVIIGGGHNGLTAAAYIQKSGLKACVLEKRHIVGGAAVTEEVIPGFKFSRASYVLSLLRPIIYNDLKLKEFGLQVIPRDPSSYTPLRKDLWMKARSLTLGADKTRNQNEIAKFSKKDALLYHKYEDQLSRIAETLDPLLDTTPHEIATYLNGSLSKLSLALASNSKFRKIIKKFVNLGLDNVFLFELLTASPLKILKGWFESEVLITTLAMDAAIGTTTSCNVPGSGYVLLLHSVLGECDGHRGRWGYPVGGMGAVSNAIAASAKALGAEIFTNQEVSEILLDGNGAACGVRTTDGLEVSARIVLANPTPKVTMGKLLPAGILNPTYEAALNAIDYSSGVTKINVALNKLPNFMADPNSRKNEAMPHHQTTIHINSEKISCLEEAHSDATAGRFSSRPLIEMVIPSVLDKTIAPKGGHVCLLFTQYTPYSLKSRTWDAATKEEYAKIVFGVIEDYAPGFSESVIGKEVLTPPDLESIFGVTGGNIFHGAMSPDRIFLSRPVNATLTKFASPYTPVPNLLICGSGAHPGGGVSGSPGRLAAIEVVKALNKNLIFK